MEICFVFLYFHFKFLVIFVLFNFSREGFW